MTVNDTRKESVGRCRDDIDTGWNCRAAMITEVVETKKSLNGEGTHSGHIAGQQHVAMRHATIPTTNKSQQGTSNSKERERVLDKVHIRPSITKHMRSQIVKLTAQRRSTVRDVKLKKQKTCHIPLGHEPFFIPGMRGSYSDWICQFPHAV